MNDDVRQGIRAYLDDVASHAQQLSEEDRRDLLENLECHIREALGARVTGEATVADLEAVLAEMDPPERYAARDSVIPPRKRASTAPEGHAAQSPPVCVTAGDVWRNVAHHIVIPIGILVFLIFIMPKFMRFFADMDVALPRATLLVLSLSAAVSHGAALLPFIAILAIGLDAGAFFFLARFGGKGAGRLWTWAVVLLQFVFFLMLAGAVYLPLRALQTP